MALAKAFGCARVEFNDALTPRTHPHEQGLPFITDAHLSRTMITQVKRRQSPPGRRGLQGEQGQQGEPGVSGYEQVTASNVTSSGNTAVCPLAVAACPAGKVVTGGRQIVSAGFTPPPSFVSNEASMTPSDLRRPGQTLFPCRRVKAKPW